MKAVLALTALLGAIAARAYDEADFSGSSTQTVTSTVLKVRQAALSTTEVATENTAEDVSATEASTTEAEGAGVNAYSNVTTGGNAEPEATIEATTQPPKTATVVQTEEISAVEAATTEYAGPSIAAQNNTNNNTTIPLLLDATLDDLLSGLQANLFTSVDLVTAYIARIHEVNSTLHVVTELNPDALAIASALDAQRANGTVLGPLHGIPILLKNNIATHDAMNNTAGSWALVGAKVGEDSTVAAKLRKAGAILLGKSNLSQWEFFRSLNTTSGWSAHGGQTKGAYIENQDPNGSSSGSAVAASLGLAFASIGTETMGSIVLPAGVANVVGIKPTVGLTSRHLVVPISPRQDTVGPIARTVRDAARILQVIAGVDERDNYTSAIPRSLRDEEGANFVCACDATALQGVRIGIPYNVLDLYTPALDPSELAAFSSAVQEITSLGATIVPANFTAFETWTSDQNSSLVLAADFLSSLPQYLSHLSANSNNISDLASLRNWTHTHPEIEAYPERDTLIWDFALGQTSNNNTSPQVWDAYAVNIFYGGEGGILSALHRNNVNAVILPTSIAPSIPALVGSPIITVPMGAHEEGTEVVRGSGFGKLVTTGPNVPIGISFLGRMWGDRELIGYAYAFEQRTGWRGKVRPVVEPRTEVWDVLAGTGGGGGNGTGSSSGNETAADGPQGFIGQAASFGGPSLFNSAVAMVLGLLVLAW